MKLKELLNNLFVSGINDQDNQNAICKNAILASNLSTYKDELLKCDEFKDLDGLIIIDNAAFLIDEIPHIAKLNKLGNEEIKGTLYLYGLYILPDLNGEQDLYIKGCLKQ